MKDKKKLIISIAIILVIVILIVLVINGVKKSNNRKTSFEGNTATSNVVLEDIEFKNITKNYENGVTSIRAEIYNNTQKVKDINVKIILKDDSGKEIASMIQTVEGIEAGRKKILQTGMMGDYTQIKDVEFKVLSNDEINKINK